MREMVIQEEVVLPPYVRVHFSKSGNAYFRFEASTKMRSSKFPISSLPLGTDFTAAIERYSRDVLPLLKTWRQNREAIPINDGPLYGTLSWAFEMYKQTMRYRHLAESTKGTNVNSIRRCCNYVMQNGVFAGRRLGDIPIQKLTPTFADDFYEEYLVTKMDKDGNPLHKKRSRLARNDIQTLRTMLNAIKRRYGHLLHNGTNPFEGIYMPHRAKKALGVNLPQLAAFVRTADKMGLSSVSAIVLFAWEMQARVTHFPFDAKVEDYRSKFRRDEIFVRAEKVDDAAYFALFNDDGEPLYPALIQRLDALKGERTTGPLFVRDKSDSDQPTTWSPTPLRKAMAAICRAAGLPNLTLTQFRTGGLTESGSAGLTTTQIMSQSLHKLEQTVQIYIDRNQEVTKEGQTRRLNWRCNKAKRGVEIVT